jgi:hypothetical protein
LKFEIWNLKIEIQTMFIFNVFHSNRAHSHHSDHVNIKFESITHSLNKSLDSNHISMKSCEFQKIFLQHVINWNVISVSWLSDPWNEWNLWQ